MEKIIQITAAKGPTECCWVVAQVLKLFLIECKENGILYSILQQEKGAINGTVQSVSIQISGTNLETFTSSWLGTIQWVGCSTIRKYHKRKNWFIGVFELEQANKVSISHQDIRFKTMRSKGPGGQHVNKVNTAVRAIHNPTSIQVVVMESRSQHQNKKIAIERLMEKVKLAELELLKNSITLQWKNHWNVERGNPIRVFKGTDFKKQVKQKSFKSKRLQAKKDLRNEIL